MLCQSCVHCADGIGGNRKCYLNIDNPLPMAYIRYEERENCKWYEHSDEPSWKRYSFERCPCCNRSIPVYIIGNGATERRCDKCFYHVIR